MRGVPAAITACAASVTGLLAPAQAQAPPRPAAQAPASQADPAQEASKTAFERLDEAERKAIQNDLIWSGDFNGVAGGEFGRRTYDAMVGFERRQRLVADGILTPPERQQLKAAADTARAAVRFNAVTDPATGIRIGLPQGLLTQRVAVENGVVWRRQDGQMSLQLGLYPAGANLAALFEQMRQDGPGRKVTYRLQRPDWFVVSGEEGQRRFYTRVASGPQGVRGYTFRYPATEAASADRLMIAIANSFEPFPGTEAVPNPARVAQPGAPPPTLIQPSMSSAPRFAVSGIALGGGRVLTSAPALRACTGATVNGQPVDPGVAFISGDVAIITVAGLTQAAASFAAPAAEARFALSFDSGEARAVMVSPVQIERDGGGSRARSTVQVGAGGAPLVDGQGRVMALVREGPGGRRHVAGVAPEASFALIMPEALEAALRQAGITPQTAPRQPTNPLAAAASALVEIRCARPA